MPKTVQFTQGSIIFFEGAKDSNIYILQSGAVALKSRDLETGTIVSENVRIGEFFGVKSALAHMPSLVTASVLVNSVVVMMNVTEFEKLFSSKQAITEKMLRVFSKSLRDIHRKIEGFFKSGIVAISPEVGMLSVAKAFFNDEQYKTCLNVLDRIAEISHNPTNKDEIEKLRKDALRKQEYRRSGSPTFVKETASSESSSLSVNQFSLPAFDRFTKKYSQGDVIISEFEPGETFYLIKYGEVQICKCINSQNKSLDILTGGQFFGEMAILDNSQRSASCIARTDVACLEFNRANFRALVLSNPQIVMNLLKIFTKRIYDQYRQFKIVLIKELPVRICDVFLMYDELQGTATTRSDENPVRKFNISVNDISSWAAVSHQQAQSELSDLVARGKIEIFDGYINVKNIHDMRRIVDNYYMKMEAFNKALQS